MIARGDDPYRARTVRGYFAAASINAGRPPQREARRMNPLILHALVSEANAPGMAAAATALARNGNVTIGALLRLAEFLTAGALAGAVLGGRSRATSALAGASLLAASAMTRWGIFQAGMASARDPKYTIVPQRRSLEGMN